ncbi:hypothetical protein [Caldicellulosiruptor morganii]|uniref:Uncharacterized protein n=1 Tax=Caldicellulosiruptor morganii TaxID=1387555 RepID=A0ABY7BRG9_9FIRM|nr:hypothetical protein [Caldicellulosiruptor morganii]WAM34191.1 hypothetical protein OTK00_000369 [Caldicellulosiruptor morganii]
MAKRNLYIETRHGGLGFDWPYMVAFKVMEHSLSSLNVKGNRLIYAKPINDNVI